MAAYPDELQNETEAELVPGVRRRLYDKSRLLAPETTLAVIQELRDWIAQELAFEEGASASFGKILSELRHANYPDQLPSLLNRFERLVAAYFVRRGSVLAFHGFCTTWRDEVMRRVLDFAGEAAELELSEGAPPYALLASGSIGRREQTIDEAERYFLVWKGAERDYFTPFSYRVLAILDQSGLLTKEGSALYGKAVWCGSLAEWSDSLAVGTLAPERAQPVEFLADLRQVCGDAEIGAAAVEQARLGLESLRAQTKLQDVAREVSRLPVALTLLGGIRVDRAGAHRGCCNPERCGLYPLEGGVRLLAVACDLEAGSTLERLAALGALGVLDAVRVGELTAAYHHLAGLKIRREIALESPYLNPATLGEAERRSLQEALNAVRQLQRELRQRYLGKGRTRRTPKQ